MAADDTAADFEAERIFQLEETRVARRYREARDAKWTRKDAHEFSRSDCDIGRLRGLKKAGCDPETAARILL